MRLAHTVFFTLKPDSPISAEQLSAACAKYLKDHPGVEFFASGARGSKFQREVNDLDFDVSLHLVFDNKASHDAYQQAEAHFAFIDENKEAWASVRVFDSYLA